jgi:hypothetical protein
MRRRVEKPVVVFGVATNTENLKMYHQLKFRQLSGSYAIVRLASGAPVPEWASLSNSTTGEFTSITRTADELSVVCPTENLPRDVQSSHRWICLKLEGPFPFSLTGVLLSFIQPLSDNGIPIFAISTYDTDYVLLQEPDSNRALDALVRAGHTLGDDESHSH